MPIHRRALLAGGLGLLAGRASAADEEFLVLRRAQRADEDSRWYQLGQRGPYTPQPEPALMPLGQGRALVHSPRGLSSAPLIVFSHGALTDPIAYRSLLQHWVSHGFVVAAPKHDDSILERGLLTRRSASVGASVWEVDRVLTDANAWDARVEACRVPLEHADVVGKAIGMQVRTDRPIIAGHEFGAFVAQLVLGASVVNDAGKALSFADRRWYGGILLSAQGPGIMGLTETSWDALDRPLLIAQAASESDFTGQEPLRKIEAYKRAPAGHKYLSWYEQAERNLYLGPRSGKAENTRDTAQFEDMKAMTTAYALAYANQDAGLYAALNTDWPERSARGRMSARHR